MMKIGIIVHSQTGNTLSVAEKILERLVSDGHQVELVRLQNVGETSPQKPVVLTSVPEVLGYDGVIFGAWVEGFSLCIGMTQYLQQIKLENQQLISCFVTEYFPYKWLGGKRAILQMQKILELQGTEIETLGVINWSNKKRTQQIDELINQMSARYC